jgi:hypothetical protein
MELQSTAVAAKLCLAWTDECVRPYASGISPRLWPLIRACVYLTAEPSCAAAAISA